MVVFVNANIACINLWLREVAVCASSLCMLFLCISTLFLCISMLVLCILCCFSFALHFALRCRPVGSGFEFVICARCPAGGGLIILRVDSDVTVMGQDTWKRFIIDGESSVKSLGRYIVKKSLRKIAEKVSLERSRIHRSLWERSLKEIAYVMIDVANRLALLM